MKFSENELIPFFSIQAFAAGKVYQRQGRVLSCVQDQAGQITARVHGNERQPYKQTITLARSDHGTLAVSGNCSCPVGFNCKHVAAALLEGLDHSTNRKQLFVIPTLRAQGPAGYGTVPQLMPAPLPDPNALPPAVADWLKSLELAEASLQEDFPDVIKGRLLYILEPVFQARLLRRLGLKLVTTRLLKDGSLSTAPGKFNFEAAFSGSNAPKYLRPADMRILRALRALQTYHYGSDFSAPLAAEGGAGIVAEILATGRAHWLAGTGPVLTLGEPRLAKIIWQPAGSEAMQPTLETDAGLMALHGQPPLYVDLATSQLGRLDTGLPAKIAAALLAAPPVPLEHLASLGASMAERLPRLAGIRPQQSGPAVTVSDAPVPVLRLFGAEVPGEIQGAGSYYYSQPALEHTGLARLTFRYGPIDIGYGETRPVLTRVRAGQVYEVQRDLAAERLAMAALLSHGLAAAPLRRKNVPKEHAQDLLPEGGELGWFDVIYFALPDLRDKGFEIVITDDFPVQLLRADGDVAADIGEGSGIDWLELSIGVMVDGERIDLVGPIVELISRGFLDAQTFDAAAADDDPVYLPLGNGRFIALPAARFAPIVNAIYELAGGGALGAAGGKLRLTRADAAGIGAFEEATLKAGVIWRGGEAIRAMGRKLSATGGIPPVALPPSFTANLRPYQAEGVAWLAFLRDVGLGGILADDMGLGKTVQALALVAIEQAAGRLDVPALVVAPTSLMANWRREAEKFTPGLRVLTLQGADRRSRFDAIADSDLVLTTYPLIGRDHEIFAGRPWHLLFLDEAQTIKNPDAATTQLIRGLEARHRFCLTGTPLENHLGELWSLFAFASPGFLGERSNFTKIWRNPIEKKGNSERGRLLAKRVKPFMLRRTKAEVASELPPKTEIIERVEMETAQRDIYESIRLSMHKKVQDAIAAKGFARSRIVILDALLKLRQVCCDPRLLKLLSKSAAKAGSAKLERLEEMLEELTGEGRKIIVFSQFTSMLDLIKPMLERMKIPYALLTGQTKDREREINRFRDTAVPVFLISLKAGGTGLNLTEADTVILYDPWWNPAVEEQAIDRAHRIGQDKPVFVHKLVVTGTIEEKMEVLKEKKRALAASIFDNDGTPTLAMTESDLDMLFAGD